MAGRVTFSEDNVKTGGLDFPKLKLQQVGEFGRILCVEWREGPMAAYIHTLRKVRIVNGRPATTIAEKKDGTKYEDYVKDFVGQPLCLGDEGILAERGVDPDHCPGCAESKRSDMIEGPKRRFAMHVIKYATRPGSPQIQIPYQVQCVVWAFTENVFTKLTAIAVEAKDLLQHDLTLGPLIAPVNFQKFEIGIAMSAEWLADVQRRDLTWATYQQNQAPDLEAIIGRKVQAKFMEDDIQTIRDTWAIANGFGNQPHINPSIGFDANSLTQGLEGLLGGQNGQPAPQAQPAPQPDPWAALAGGPQGLPPVAQPAVVTQVAPPPAPIPDGQAVQQVAATIAGLPNFPSAAPAGFVPPPDLPLPAAQPAAAANVGLPPGLPPVGQPAPQIQSVPPAQQVQMVQPVVPPVTNPSVETMAAPVPSAPDPTAPGQPGVVSSFEDLLRGIAGP